MTIPIALDTNAIKPLLRYGADIYEKIAQGELRIYLPIPVYAEQIIYPASVIENLMEAFDARIVPLRKKHVDDLGKLWYALPAQQRGPHFWKPHKYDWLIVAMAYQEGWILVTNDDGPPFQSLGAQVLTVDDFVEIYV